MRDSHLYIKKLSNEIAITLGILCRLKNFSPTDILRTLYDSLILPYLDY